MWRDPNFIDLVYKSLAVLLPIIPAYIVFKFLPAEAHVGGPFRGLKLNLTGAFGGYFILVVLILYAPRPKWEPTELWTVRGQFGNPIAKNNEISVTMDPPFVQINGDNTFVAYIPVTWNNGKPGFPTLRVDRQPAGQFAPATIHLDQMWLKIGGDHFKLERDEAQHEINIIEPVPFKMISSPYNEKGSP
jgi:hypothetical protein